MQGFEYYTPTKVVFGKDTENRACLLYTSSPSSSPGAQAEQPRKLQPVRKAVYKT